MLFTPRKKPSLASRMRNLVWPRGGLRRASLYIWRRVTRISAPPHYIALGFACGVFASFTPYVGFHFIIAGIIAFVLRGSILASALGTSFGNPLSFPFIWYATYNLGAFLLGFEPRSSIEISFPEGMMMMLFTDPGGFWRAFWAGLGPYIAPMTVGALPLGFIAGAIFYFIVKPAVKSYQNRRRDRLAMRYSDNHREPS